MSAQKAISGNYYPLSRFRTFAATLMIVGALLGTGGVPPAAASHTDSASPRLHNWNIHYAEAGHSDFADEDFCAQSYDEGRISTATARDWVFHTLTQDSPRWDGTGGGRIDLWLTDQACDFVPDPGAVELRYIIMADPSSVGGNCTSDNISCVNHTGAVYSPGYGHSHYMAENIYLDTDNIIGGISAYHQLINHETGHAWSLIDPSFVGDCPDSIMHTFNYYGCPYREFPTASDYDSVVGVADGTR